MEQEYVLELRQIRKEFPGVVALKNVTLSVKPGTVHSIVGENGAGKSTLMKIIKGVYQPTSGEIHVGGEKKVFGSPYDSEKAGIGMVFQELQFVPQLTVAENMFVGRMPVKKAPFIVDWKEVNRKARELLDNEGIDIDPKAKIGTLPIADIQMLEIVKVTAIEGLKVIILDEPTSSLSHRETERLFGKIEDLRKRGVTILYISHKLEEIFRLSDYVTVIRDGEVIDTRPIGEFDHDTIVTEMVGREISDTYPKEHIELGEKVLEIQNLCSGKRFQNINFYAKRGEILGLAGLVGAGRTEVSRAIAGIDRFDSGKIIVEGKEIKIKSVTDAVSAGIMTVTEDRRKSGFIGIRCIRENIALPNLSRFSKFGVLRRKLEKKDVDAVANRLRVKAASWEVRVQTLSGGNQQKVVLAKWLIRNPKILILDEPTRGIDVGAKHEIYKLMTEMVKTGITVIMISSELPELIGMVDRTYVMSSGRIVGELEGSEISQESIMKFAAGGN